MSEILVHVGKRIRQIRKARNLSQHALAEKCGFTFSYIGGIERAEKNISLSNLEIIANGLDVAVHQFFVYSYEYENLTPNEQLIKELILMLIEHDPETIEMAKNILTEVLKYARK